MSVVIYESDMRFGEYENDQVFHIEKSTQYTEKLMPNGIKSCEFILKRDGKLYFVEAKTSCPKQITADSTEEKQEKYYEYIKDITLKMRHSLELYSCILLRRYPDDGVPESLSESDLSNADVKLVLVVKNAKKEWLVPLEDAFNRSLQAELKIWKIQRVFVINEQMAREKGLSLMK